MGRLQDATGLSGKIQERLAKFSVDNSEGFSTLSITDFARRNEVSETTVVRFCKALGYKGYRDFRISMVESNGLARGVQLLGVDFPEDAAETNSFSGVIRKVVQINGDVLVDTLKLLDGDALERAVEMIRAANHVHFVGFGSSSAVAVDAFQRLMRLGVRASCYSDPHVVATLSANVGKDDLLFGISYSGATRDLVEALEATAGRGAGTIVLTSYPMSPVTQIADISLISALRRTPIPAESIASRISQLVVIDALCVGIAMRHPRKADFVRGLESLEREIEKKRLPRRRRPSRSQQQDDE